MYRRRRVHQNPSSRLYLPSSETTLRLAVLVLCCKREGPYPRHPTRYFKLLLCTSPPPHPCKTGQVSALQPVTREQSLIPPPHLTELPPPQAEPRASSSCLLTRWSLPAFVFHRSTPTPSEGTQGESRRPQPSFSVERRIAVGFPLLLSEPSCQRRPCAALPSP